MHLLKYFNAVENGFVYKSPVVRTLHIAFRTLTSHSMACNAYKTVLSISQRIKRTNQLLGRLYLLGV